MSRNDRLLIATRHAALAYAAQGWHVFPLRPDDKRPACPGHAAAKCDRSDPWCSDGHTGWETRATTDTSRITRAWSGSSDGGQPYGIGIATGPSRLVVVDLDQPKDGVDTTPPPSWNVAGVRDGHDVLALLCDRAGQPIPWDTYTVRTGRGGTHLYFTAPADSQLRNTSSSLGWLVDTRAGGGYVVAAPSTVAGRPYTVIDGRDPAPLPAWLADALGPRRPQGATTGAAAPPRRPPAPGAVGRYVEAAVSGEVSRIKSATPGQRNQALFLGAVAIGQLVGANAVSRPNAQDALLAASADHIAAGAFSTAEAVATIRSGLSRGIAEPRQLPDPKTRTTSRGAA
ncbi:bifunctional DNA primase/polymerase [Angustibacter sp. McL0619]|uniref:bifunctional DNA primase/polymerase n=1 Tax=Angustibacter sp. McL0619 TaxID=3415676 RepID=UPI003CFB4289